MIARAASALPRSFALATRAQPVLPGYHRQRSPLERYLKHGLFLAACVMLGCMYGFFFSVFPPFLLVYLAIPILLLVLLTIWVLPDLPNGPVRLLERLFFALLVISVLWPTYLAISLPGLPWVSFRRLVGVPLAVVLLICLSTSKNFRENLRSGLNGVPLVWKLLIAFLAVQFVTIFLSPRPFMSLNVFLNNILTVYPSFFIAAWLCNRPGRASKLATLIIGAGLFLCVLGLVELKHQGVLWANSIPSLLQVGDESVARALKSVLRDGDYRVTTIFPVSLSFAEFMAIASAFALHRLLTARRISGMVLWAAVDFLFLVVIFFTRARLGLVGWLVAHAIYVSLWAVRRWRSNKADLISPAIALAYPVFVALFFVSMFTVDAVKYRTIGGGSSGISDQGRHDQFALFWPKLFSNPLGYGAGQSGDVLGYRTPGGQVSVDSYLISLALDYGVVGLVLFFAIFGFAAYKFAEIGLKSRNAEGQLLLPLAASLGVILVIRFVLSQEDNMALCYLLLGAGLAICARATASRASAVAVSPALAGVARQA